MACIAAAISTEIRTFEPAAGNLVVLVVTVQWLSGGLVFETVFENTYFSFFFRFQKNMTLRFLNDSEKNAKVGSKNFVLNDANIVTKKKKFVECL